VVLVVALGWKIVLRWFFGCAFMARWFFLRWFLLWWFLLPWFHGFFRYALVVGQFSDVLSWLGGFFCGAAVFFLCF
jgi:hypothetical protein